MSDPKVGKAKSRDGADQESKNDAGQESRDSAGQGSAPAALDPFDPARIRLGQNFSESLAAKKELTHIPVKKPGSQEFVRVSRDEAMRITAALLECHWDREQYLVAPEMVDEVGKDAKPTLLLPAMTATGTFFIWPLKITPEGARENTWNLTANAAAHIALEKWVKVTSNQAAQGYESHVARGDIAEPEWPELSLAEILRLAFKDRYIDSPEHPVVLRLRGIFQ